MTIRALAGTSTAVAIFTVAVAPAAQAGSDVAGPPQSYAIVQPAGAPCEFPVQWDVVDKEGFIETKQYIFNFSPSSHVTLTNLDNGHL